MVKIGIVALVTSEYSGSYRAQDIIDNAVDILTSKNINTVKARKIVNVSSAAVEVCDQFKTEKIDGLIVIDINWVVDSLQYIFVNELRLPTIFWALPFNETYSLACVHHFGSFLKSQNVPFDYVYGDCGGVVEKIEIFHNTVKMIKAAQNMRIGLIGPRQTWRVAGAQDITSEEFEFSRVFGSTILHIEMDEVINCANKFTDDQIIIAKKELLARSGSVCISDKAFDFMTRMYLATKETIKKYHLNAIAAETCPNYSGLMNIQSSWLADEGFVVDTEGDISHTVLQTCLNQIKCSPAFLGEICSLNDKTINLYHEGSTAHSLSQAIDQVKILESGELGCYIGLSVKHIEEATIFNIAGNDGNYYLFSDKAKVETCTDEEWEKAGKGCLAKVELKLKPDEAIDYLIKSGADHHFVIKEGNYLAELQMFCNYLGIYHRSLPEQEEK